MGLASVAGLDPVAAEELARETGGVLARVGAKELAAESITSVRESQRLNLHSPRKRSKQRFKVRLYRVWWWDLTEERMTFAFRNPWGWVGWTNKQSKQLGGGCLSQAAKMELQWRY